MRPLTFRLATFALALVLPPAARAQVTEDQKLLASDASHGARFGDAIALVETEAEVLALVGAPFEETLGDYAGATYAFRYDEAAGAWVEEAKLLPEGVGPYSNFGRSVAISADGSTALIGGGVSGEDIFTPGLVHAYVRQDGVWIEQARLSPSDSAVGDEFGCSVAVSATGEVVVVGACGADGSYNASGAAYVFRRDGTAGEWVQEAKVSTMSFCFFTAFGTSVAMSDPGDRFIVGESCTHQGDIGHAHVFHRSGPPEEPNGGWALEAASEPVGGDAVALSAEGDLALAGIGYEGEVVVLRREGAAWVREGEGIRAGDGSSSFGDDDVALEGDLALIGDRVADGQVPTSGAAYLFRRQGKGIWTEEVKLVASDGADLNYFGEAVALSERFVIVGAVYADAAGSRTGAAYAYDLTHMLPAEPAVPEEEALALSAYPNPFALAATLSYVLPEPGPVRLTIYDVLGREVATLVDEVQAAGAHRVAIPARALPAGTYLARLATEDYVRTRRMTRVR